MGLLCRADGASGTDARDEEDTATPHRSEMSPPGERPPTGTAQSEEWPETGASPWLLVEGSCALGHATLFPGISRPCRQNCLTRPKVPSAELCLQARLRALPSCPSHSQCLHTSLSSLPRGSPRAVPSARNTTPCHTPYSHADSPGKGSSPSTQAVPALSCR